jgi:hypothetical protein
MTATVSMTAQRDAERAAARYMKAKADLMAALATMAQTIAILGTILGIVATFDLVAFLITK